MIVVNHWTSYLGLEGGLRHDGSRNNDVLKYLSRPTVTKIENSIRTGKVTSFFPIAIKSTYGPFTLLIQNCVRWLNHTENYFNIVSPVQTPGHIRDCLIIIFIWYLNSYMLQKHLSNPQCDNKTFQRADRSEMHSRHKITGSIKLRDSKRSRFFISFDSEIRSFQLNRKEPKGGRKG